MQTDPTQVALDANGNPVSPVDHTQVSLDADGNPVGAAPPLAVSHTPSSAPAASPYAQRVQGQYGLTLQPTNTPPPTVWQRLVNVGKGALEAFDPRNQRGRLNLAGAAGAVSVPMLATAALGAVTAQPEVAIPALALSGLGIAGSAGAGAAEAKVEQKLGTGVGETPGRAALVQGAQTGTGELGWGALRLLGSKFAGTWVGRQAQRYLEDTLSAVKDQGTKVMDAVRTAMSAEKAQTSADTREAVNSAMSLRDRAETLARQKAAATKAQTEIDNAARLQAAQAAFDRVNGTPPNQATTADIVQGVLRGSPGIKGPEGPAIAVLNQAGKKIGEAAESGPAVDMRPVKAAMDKIGENTYPAAYVTGGMPPGAQYLLSSHASSGVTPAEQAAFTKTIAEKLGVPETHPLPGILGKIQQGPDEIPFKDAHVLKRLLAYSVNYDQNAASALEGATKGTLGALRAQLDQYAPYAAANDAYEALAPLYRDGIGLAAIRAAADNPDKLGMLLDSKFPTQAQDLRRLLVEQSAAGGDPRLGQAAWQAVREHYGYNTLIAKGPEGLSDRVQTLLTQSPQFVKTVFGDADGQAYLNRLQQIGRVYDEAVSANQAATSATRGANTADLQGVTQRWEAGIREARQVGASAQADIEQRASQAILAAQRGIDQTSRSTASQIQSLQRSSLGRYIGTGQLAQAESQGIRVALLSPKSAWFGPSVIALLRGPSGKDLLEWAAYSSPNAKALVRALTSPVSGPAMQTIVRAANGARASAMNALRPMPSHATATDTSRNP